MSAHRWLRAALCLVPVSLLLPAGCGGDKVSVPSPAPGGPASGAAVSLESGRATTVSLPAAGGTVTATSSTGAQAALTVPAGSLLEPTTVTMTPIASLSLSRAAFRGASRSAIPILAGVQLSPDGLQFIKPSTLTLQLPAGTDMSSVVGISYDGSGENLHAVPVKVSGTQMTFTLTHFSGYAAARLSGSQIAALSTSSAAASALQQLAVLLQSTHPDTAAEAAVLTGWYNNSVKPLLTAAGSDAKQAEAAIREWNAWETTVQQLGISGLSAQESEATHLLSIVLRTAVEEANQRCAAGNLSALKDAIRYLAMAQKLGLDSVENGLDFGSNLPHLCLKLKVTADKSTLQAGESTSITASLQFGDAFIPDLSNKTINFFLSGPGTLSASSATTNANGSASVNYTAPAGGSSGSATITGSYDLGAPLPITGAAAVSSSPSDWNQYVGQYFYGSYTDQGPLKLVEPEAWILLKGRSDNEYTFYGVGLRPDGGFSPWQDFRFDSTVTFVPPIFTGDMDMGPGEHYHLNGMFSRRTDGTVDMSGSIVRESTGANGAVTTLTYPFSGHR